MLLDSSETYLGTRSFGVCVLLGSVLSLFDEPYKSLSLTAVNLMVKGRVWTVLTSLFLQRSIWFACGHFLAVLLCGAIIEQLTGTVRFVTLTVTFKPFVLGVFFVVVFVCVFFGPIHVCLVTTRLCVCFVQLLVSVLSELCTVLTLLFGYYLWFESSYLQYVCVGLWGAIPAYFIVIAQLLPNQIIFTHFPKLTPHVLLFNFLKPNSFPLSFLVVVVVFYPYSILIYFFFFFSSLPVI